MKKPWYLETTTDPIVTARAFAAAGVLTAVGWRPQEETPAESLSAAIGAAVSKPLAWSYPGVGTIQPPIVLTDRQLAATWDECWTRLSTGEPRIARLVVDIASVRRGTSFGGSTASAIHAVCRTLTGPGTALPHPGGFASAPLQPGDVAAVSFSTLREARPHEWSWPLRLGVGPATNEELQDRIRTLGAAERHGFLQIARVGGSQDVVVLAEPTPDILRSAGAEPWGIGVVGTPLQQVTWNRYRLLNSTLSASPTGPIAFLSVGREFLSDWVNEFTYAVSHNKSLDEAVFDAYRNIRPRLLLRTGLPPDFAPPILLTPKAPTAYDILGDIRLENRVKELIEELAERRAETVIDLPSDLVSSLGIRATSHTASDYVKDLKEALSWGATAFDFEREVDGATALRLIRAAVAPDTGAPLASADPAAAIDRRGPTEAAAGAPATVPAAPVVPAGAAAAVPSVSPPAPPAPPAPDTPSPGPAWSTEERPREAERFTDVAVHKGHLFAPDLSEQTRLADEVPVVEEGQYTLEVAIRRRRIGIEAGRKPPRAVGSPRRDREDVTVYVVAQPLTRGIKIKEQLATVVWPFDEDSEPAVFRMDVEHTRAEETIDVRLYDQRLDLLDIVQVVIAVVPRGSDPRDARIPAHHLVWPEKERTPLRITRDSPARLLSIHVTADATGYQFAFTFRDSADQEVKVLASRDLTVGDIQQLLSRVRDFWTDLVVSPYAHKLTVTKTTFNQHLKTLATLGQDAWGLLFDNRSGPLSGASEAIGRLLATMQDTPGAHIQVTYGDSRNHFVFPWSILYPPDAGTETVDTTLFWGTRFQIEQVRNGPNDNLLDDEPVDISFVLDSGFEQSQSQLQMFAEYEATAAGKIRVSEPISNDTALFSSLGGNPASHLYYFFCHGYAPGAGTPVGRASLQSLKDKIEQLAADSPEHKAWEAFLRLTSRMGDEALIFVGNAEITETALKRQTFFGGRRPIVFLNMCQSAELLPLMSTGLVRMFLDHNASAVVGTESPMTAVFAHEFSKVMFNKLFGGCAIGRALLDTRRHFLSETMRNPLGLAYTLYGRATARLGKRPIISAVPGTEGGVDMKVLGSSGPVIGGASEGGGG